MAPKQSKGARSYTSETLKEALRLVTSTTLTTDEILKLPICQKERQSSSRSDPSAKVISPRNTKPSTSRINQRQKEPRRSKPKTGDDDGCGSCGGTYDEDARKRNGAEWIQCQFCHVGTMSSVNMSWTKYILCVMGVRCQIVTVTKNYQDAPKQMEN